MEIFYNFEESLAKYKKRLKQAKWKALTLGFIKTVYKAYFFIILILAVVVIKSLFSAQTSGSTVRMDLIGLYCVSCLISIMISTYLKREQKAGRGSSILVKEDWVLVQSDFATKYMALLERIRGRADHGFLRFYLVRAQFQKVKIVPIFYDWDEEELCVDSKMCVDLFSLSVDVQENSEINHPILDLSQGILYVPIGFDVDSFLCSNKASWSMQLSDVYDAWTEHIGYESKNTDHAPSALKWMNTNPIPMNSEFNTFSRYLDTSFKEKIIVDMEQYIKETKERYALN